MPEGYVYTGVFDSVHGEGGGGDGDIPACFAGLQVCVCVSQHALQVSRPTPKEELEGSGQGGLQTHTWGGVSQYALRQTPRWRPLLRAVRILLECILVVRYFTLLLDKFIRMIPHLKTVFSTGTATHSLALA